MISALLYIKIFYKRVNKGRQVGSKSEKNHWAPKFVFGTDLNLFILVK